jgi:DNA replication protein DnaC
MPREKTKLHSVPPQIEREKDGPGSRSTAVPRSSDGICQICLGTGLEIVAGKGARPCVCRTRDAQTALINRARLPRRYEQCHFHNYYPGGNSSQKAALELSMDVAMKYPNVGEGLLLTGPVGVGKTHLAVSILKGLAERGVTCLFYEFGSLLKEIQDSYNPNTKSSELSVLRPVLDADVLVLDELGASKPTDWVRDTMAHIINSRYNDRRLTIFTTNYTDERKNDKDETLEDRIGVRLRSRIYEMCRAVRLTGEDYRKNIERRAAVRK